MDSNQREDDHPYRRTSASESGNFHPHDHHPTTPPETGSSTQSAAASPDSPTVKKSLFSISNWRTGRPRTKSKPSPSDAEKAFVEKESQLEAQYQEIPSHNGLSDSNTKVPQYTEEAKQLVRSFTHAALDGTHADPR